MQLNKFVKKYPIFLIFLLGLTIRLSLLFVDYSWDVNNHIVWAKDLWQRGFRGFYETQSSEVYATFYPNYPPLSLNIFYLIYPLQSIINKIAWWLNLTIPIFPSKLIFFIQGRSFLAGLFKLPGIISDLGIAWICFLISKKLYSKNLKIQKLTAIFVLFNPVFIFNTALWGQIDTLPLFFVLFSSYLLLFSQRYILSTVLFILALLAKPTALIFLPVYVVFFIRKYYVMNFLKAFIFASLVFLLLFFPFLKNAKNLFSPYLIYSQKILAAQSLPYVTNGAFNFWVVLMGFNGMKDTASFLFGFSYRVWGYIITGIVLAVIIFFGLKLKDKFYSFSYISFLGALASFLFLTKMHERYSLLPLPFLLLAYLKDRRLLKWFMVFSLLSFLNHYHSWPVPRLQLLSSTLSHPFSITLLSSLNVLLFLYFSSRIIFYQK